MAEVERRILVLIDENGGEFTASTLPLLYTKRYGQKLDWKALGFERLGRLIESLRSVVVSPLQGPQTNRKLRRVPRILQRPAAAPAPAALSGDAGEFQPSAPAAAPRRLSGDAGEFRPASPAPSAPVYAQPPIPPPPHGFVPVFAPPPPLFVPGMPVMQPVLVPPGAPPPPITIGSNSPLIISPLMPGGAPPPPLGFQGGMYYVPNQPDDEG